MSGTASVTYHYAVLRVVPHVQIGAYANVGVMLHVRTSELLLMRAVTDEVVLGRLAPDVDIELLSRYLRCLQAVCAGDPEAGPIALLPSSERFHWMTAPRSDVLQPSAVHEGLGNDPATALEELYTEFVRTS